MGKFFNTKISKDRSTLVKYGLIGAGVLLFLIIIIALSNRAPSQKLEVFKSVEDIEVSENAENYPEYDDIIKSYGKAKKEDITVDYSELDTSAIGEYTIYVTYKKAKYEVSAAVVDTTPPEATVVERLVPKENNSYALQDFILECKDNNPEEEECIYKFNKEDIYTEKGEYEYKLQICDSADNCTEEQVVIVEIGSACLYGGLTYDQTKNKYPLAVIVGDVDTNCAADKKLWQSPEFLDKVNDLYSKDLKLLQLQLTPITKDKFPGGAITKAYPVFITIYNTDGIGLVGYAIRVKVYAREQGYAGKLDIDENLIVSYSLNADGSRNYEYDAYGIE